jgi:hypothetical protein
MTEVLLNLTEVFLTLAEVSPCFFFSCKANARVKLAKTGHDPHCSKLVVICVVMLLFVCKCVLQPGDNPIAVNKYIISYILASCVVVLPPCIKTGRQRLLSSSTDILCGSQLQFPVEEVSLN